MLKNHEDKKRIVILGAGFGGIYTYLSLHKNLHNRSDIEIVMVSENDHFLFVPLLHEVAAGNLAPSSIRQSVRMMPQCCLDRFITGTVHGLDFDNKTVHYKESTHQNAPEVLGNDTISYDYLVLALGSDTNYFGTPGAEEYAFSLKNLDDAARIKNTVLDRFEEAQEIHDASEREALLRFVIVGGGPTGAELAGELGDLFNKEIKRAFPDVWNDASIVLIEGGDALVSNMGEWFSARTQDILREKHNVDVRLNTLVREVHPSGVQIDDEFMYADTVIWTAGVRAQSLDIHAKNKLSIEPHSKRIHVTDCLNLPEYDNVFVVGDQAWIRDKENGQPYPMRAQFAVREGKTVGRNVAHAIHEADCEVFRWRDKGFILSLGKGGALANIYGYRFSGIVAWWAYRLAYISRLLGVRTKLRTFLEWSLNYFSKRDISKI